MTIEMIEFFAGKSSFIFSSIVDAVSDKKELKTPQTVDLVVSKAGELMRKLLDDDQLTLQNLVDMRFERLIRSIRKQKRSFEDELAIISEFFGTKTKLKDVEVHISRLLSALKLLEFSELLPVMVQTLKDYNLACAKNPAILQLCDLLVKGKNQIPLSQVSNKIAELEKVLFNVQSFQLKYFEQVQKCKELVNFLRNEKDFKAQIEMLTAQLQKSEVEINLISSLQLSYEYLQPFLHCGSDSFEPLAKIIKQYFPSEANLDLLEHLEVVVNNFSQIQYWFSRTKGLNFADVHYTVSKLLENGQFVCKLNKTGVSVLTIRYQMDKNQEMTELQADELSDIVRSAVFCSTDESAENNDSRQDLLQFKSAYEEALEVHKLRIELQASGHPDYQVDEANLGDLSVEKLYNSRIFLQELLSKWQESIKAEVSRAKRLLKLSRSQLISLVKSLKKLKRYPADNEILLLTPFVLICFFEHFKTKLAAITLELLKSSLMAAIEEAKDKNDLQFCSEFIKQIEDRARVKEEEEHCDENNTQVVKAADQSESQLLLHILSVLGVHEVDISDENSSTMFLVQPCQIMWCNEATTVKDIQWFSERRQAFPHLTFVLVGVNNLHAHVREELLKIEERSDKLGKTYLVFCSMNGIDAFSFLGNVENWEPQNENTYQKRLKQIITDHKSRNIMHMECVYGRANNGKSTYIAKSIRELGQQVTYLQIAVNEDFSTESFLQRYLPIRETANAIAVHFNVSSYAKLQNLEHFLFNFFYCGLFVSDNQVVIPNMSTKWYIYLEVPNGIMKASVEAFLTKIPSIKFLHKKLFEIPDDYPLIVDDKLRLVAAFVERMAKNTLTAGDLQNIVGLADDNACLSLINNLFNARCKQVTNTKAHKSMFIKLMYIRCQYLKARAAKNAKYNIPDPQTPKQLFEVFLDECEHMCNADIRQNWSNFPVAFTSSINTIVDGNENVDHNILHLHSKSEQEASKAAYSLFAIDGKTCKDQPKYLRQSLAYSLGLVHTDRLIRLLESHNYVLTPDFATKLLLLSERKKVNANVILCGGTGIGKTEMLVFWASVLNANSDVQPDAGFLLSKYIKEYCGSNQLVLSLLDYYYHARSISFLIDAIKNITEHMDENAVSDFGKNLAIFARESIYEKYPLLERTPHVDRIIESLGDAQADLITLNQISQFVTDTIKAKPRGLFHKILMHGDITATIFKQRINDIVQRTVDLTKIHPNFSTVVFIDELNTSSILGIVKEVIADRTLDGVPLPNNIFFVGAINPFIEPNEGELVYLVNKID
jgi:hypothetical protein